MGDYNVRNSFPLEDLPDYQVDKGVEYPPPRSRNSFPVDDLPDYHVDKGVEQPPAKSRNSFPVDNLPDYHLDKGVEQPPPRSMNSVPVENVPQYYASTVVEPPPRLRVKKAEVVEEEDEDEEEDEEEEEEKPKEPSMLRIVLHHCLTNGGLIIFLICYTCMGAAVFQRLEAPEEERKAENIRLDRLSQRNVFLQNIKDINSMVASDETHWKNLTSNFLELYEGKLGLIVVETDENPLSSWNFYGSMFFATTVLTTIGYGNIAPVTVGGRVFCMVYAVFGIALLLLVLASIGTLLARGATLGYRRILSWCRRRRNKGKDETDVVTFQRDQRAQAVIDEGWNKGEDGDTHKVDIHGTNGETAGDKRESGEVDTEEEPPQPEAQIPLTFVLIFAFLYICFLAMLLQAWEDQWDYFEAFYFSFITLTTIGFGDLVPHHQKNLLACTFFILLGMAIMSMCIALAQEMIIQKVAWLSKKIGVAFASHKRKPSDDSS